MTDRTESKEKDKSLTETVGDLIAGLIDALDDLLGPKPELVPIPVRRRYPPRR